MPSLGNCFKPKSMFRRPMPRMGARRAERIRTLGVPAAFRAVSKPEFHSASGRSIGMIYLLSRDKRLEKRLRCRSAHQLKKQRKMSSENYFTLFGIMR